MSCWHKFTSDPKFEFTPCLKCGEPFTRSAITSWNAAMSLARPLVQQLVEALENHAKFCLGCTCSTCEPIIAALSAAKAAIGETG